MSILLPRFIVTLLRYVSIELKELLAYLIDNVSTRPVKRSQSC